ncbi:N-6 DNA methylase [Nocardiopsis oceani]
MSEGARDTAQALVGSADIARLAGVRRPAVSNWRRRFDDFPAPVGGSADRPLFGLEEIRDWCREHGKEFEADGADLLWQRVRTEVPDVRRTAFLAHAGRLLTGEVPREAGAPVEGWAALADQVLDAAAPEEVYERLAARWAALRSRAETDADLAAWMADLAEVGPGQRVLDPACGGGGLLVAAARRGAAATLGQERDADAAAIATARLVHRVTLNVTAVGDTLRAPHPALDAEPADAVLCDPPFRDRDWGHEELAEDPRWAFGLPPRGEGELAWVQHCLSRVRPGGRVVVTVPASVSYRPAGRRIRAALLRDGALRAVLEVPGDADEAGRQVWVLEGTGTGEGAPTRNRVLLAGALEREESLRLYLDFLQGSLPEDATRALVVEAADLVDDEVDLRPGRHLAEATRGRADVHYTPLLEELGAALARARELVPEVALEGAETPMTTLGALVDEGALELLRAPLTLAADGGDLPVLTVQDLRTGRPAGGRCRSAPGLVTTETGDVVVAETVRDAPVLVVSEAGAVLGPRLVAVRAAPGRIDPAFLARAVRPEAVAAGRTASGRADLRSLRIPALSPPEQRAYTRVWADLEEQREITERIAELGARLAELGDRGLREGAVRPRRAEA